MQRWFLAALAALLSGPSLADEPALAKALRAGDEAAVEQALAAGAEADAAFPDGMMTPLGLAITQGNTGLAEILLDHGASANTPGAIGMPPLAIAAQSCRAGPDMVALLLARGAEIDAPAPGGMTPLLIAALMGRDDLMAMLIDSGADASVVDVFGDGMLNFAIYARNPDQVQLALSAGSGTDQLDKLFLTRGYRAYVWPGPPRCDGEG
jgi:uncharacterized protein